MTIVRALAYLSQKRKSESRILMKLSKRAMKKQITAQSDREAVSNSSLHVKPVESQAGLHARIDIPGQGCSTTACLAPPSKQHPKSPRLRPSLHPTKPLSHDYTWLLDRETTDSDHLVVRINESGRLLKPILVFKPVNWKRRKVLNILDNEKARLPEGVTTTFKFDEYGQHYIQSSRIFKPYIQFCAIVPLEPKKYVQHFRSLNDEDRLYKPLETLLRLSELVSTAKKTSEQWCRCRPGCKRFSTSMIQCNHTACKSGWYHKRCMGMDEDEIPKDGWLCKYCSWLSKKRIAGTDTTVVSHDKLAEASTSRIQRAKGLEDAWQNHDWPSATEIMSMFDTIARKMEVFEGNR